MVATTFVVSGSRAGIGSAAVTDGNTAQSYMVSDVGAETALPLVTNVLTGQNGSAQIGTPTVEIDDAVTGVAGTGGVGSFTASLSVSPTGLAATTAIGTPTAYITVFFTLTGVAATASVGTPSAEIDFTLDGLEAATALGTEIWEIDKPISGLAAAATIGTPLAEGSSAFTPIGQQVVTAIGLPLAIVTPNMTNVTPTGQQAVTGLGTVAKTLSVVPVGQAAVAGLGTPQVVTYQSGMQIGDLECAEPKNADDIFVGLRWSDSYGEAWNFPLHQSKGSEGQYLTNLQFRRLGLARNRVFEVSWSSPTPTALQGVTLQFEEAGT